MGMVLAYAGDPAAATVAEGDQLINRLGEMVVGEVLEGMGIKTGVNLDKLVECVWLLERILGRQTWGHVSRAGPRPMEKGRLFNANAPFVETLEQAKHFMYGPKSYEGGISPWVEPITSPYLERLEKGLPMYELNGNWPWQEDFFPKVKDLEAAGVVIKKVAAAA